MTVATNNGCIHPLVNVKRYNRKLRRECTLPQPNVINDYNQHMGGVDLLDNGIANYRIKVRGKKWWWPFFTNLVDCTIVNAWKIYNIANCSQLPQIEFRSYLVLALLQISDIKENESKCKQEDKRKLSLGRPSKDSLPSEVRYDKGGHNITRHAKDKRRRCRLCKTNSVYMCDKCNVHLHSKCFTKFHKI